VHEAFERGVNYYDVAPAYGKGTCETKLGIALQGLDRSRYFLACKTKKLDRDGAPRSWRNSLRQLRTDHFDVYQLHHLVKPADVQAALGPGGVLEMLLQAKAEGKIRAIGFSAHTTKAALAALRGYAFDTVMFPINYVEYYTRGFGKEVLALAKEKQAAVLSIKTLNAGAWPKDSERTRKWWYRSLETQDDINLAYRGPCPAGRGDGISPVVARFAVQSDHGRSGLPSRHRGGRGSIAGDGEGLRLDLQARGGLGGKPKPAVSAPSAGLL
jgi:aryl-alcohol dehydrogenase-like predicted oxidoreductase